MKPKITITGSKVVISSFECNTLGKVSQKTIDMGPYAGKYVRIWLDADGTYSLDRHKNHYWQMAEFQVPEQEYQEVDTGEEDPDTGEPIINTEPAPLDLNTVEIETWELPE